jgi:hypothetical protein
MQNNYLSKSNLELCSGILNHRHNLVMGQLYNLSVVITVPSNDDLELCFGILDHGDHLLIGQLYN